MFLMSLELVLCGDHFLFLTYKVPAQWRRHKHGLIIVIVDTTGKLCANFQTGWFFNFPDRVHQNSHDFCHTSATKKARVETRALTSIRQIRPILSCVPSRH